METERQHKVSLMFEIDFFFLKKTKKNLEQNCGYSDRLKSQHLLLIKPFYFCGGDTGVVGDTCNNKEVFMTIFMKCGQLCLLIFYLMNKLSLRNCQKNAYFKQKQKLLQH